MKNLRVELGARSYAIHVGQGILRRSGPILKQAGFVTPPVVVSNRRVMQLHGLALVRSLEKTFGPISVITIGDGERHKNIRTLQQVWDSLFSNGADRHAWVVAFGGGVVGDLGGFAAATFMRGIRYVHIPTTLLAQVDSSIGGKVGINVAQGKNLVGAFHQPKAVIVDIEVLRTLPRPQLCSGLYEIVKCGAICSIGLLNYLDANMDEILAGGTEALEHLVLVASRIKARIVSGDEREDELRMVLNYGHTVGHALESATGYRKITHGEAVGWGMIAAIGYGNLLGLLPAAEQRRLIDLIHRVEDLPSLRGVSLARVWRALGRDKKAKSGRISLILLTRLGRTEIRSGIESKHLRGFLKKFLDGWAESTRPSSRATQGAR